MRARRGRLSALFLGLVLAPAPAAAERFLWSFSSQPDLERRSSLSQCAGKRFYPESISLLDAGDRPRWRATVPPRLRGLEADCSVMLNLSRAHDPSGDHYNYAGGRPLIGLLATSAAVVVGYTGGVLVLERQTGKPLLVHDARTPKTDDFFRFDAGTWTLRRGRARRCQGTARGGTLLGICDGRLLFFDGTVAAVIDAGPYRVQREVLFARRFERSARACRSAPGVLRRCASIPLGSVSLELEGIDHR